VITGELVAGRLYSVGAFAEQLGVSATPVREALGDLANAGLVEVIRNRGFLVPELTEHDLDEIFQLRLMLEVPAIEQVAGHLDADAAAACQGHVDEGTRCAATEDLPGFLEADRRFHHELLSALGNARLVEIIDRLRDQTRLYGLPDLARSGRLTKSAEEHENLLRLVVEGDAKGARDQMFRHLEHTRGVWAGHDEPDGAD
jgi:DNA-binding GntR family transcriptional regulator